MVEVIPRVDDSGRNFQVKRRKLFSRERCSWINEHLENDFPPLTAYKIHDRKQIIGQNRDSLNKICICVANGS